jgi:hypothetical protein
MCYPKLFAAACTATVLSLTACTGNRHNAPSSHIDTARTTVAQNPPLRQTQALPHPATMPPNIIIRAIATGDLNKDNIADSVIVTVDTAADTQPVMLNVFFGSANGYMPAVQTDSALSPLRAGGRNGYMDGNDFDTATIANGVLTLSEVQLRGNTGYRYRFQNGHFEMIGYTSSQSDGRGTAYDVDYNLMTGRLIYSETNYETDAVIKKRDIKIKQPIRPKLEEHVPGNTEVQQGDVDILL